MRRRRICFVTGTRAEFGLMRSTLTAIREHPSLSLQIIATGMHLSDLHGRSVDGIRAQGWKVDATVPWKKSGIAVETGNAMSGMAKVLDRLKSDIVLVVGDRVEAFAAAAAGHLSGRIVAHVHGGDRALGQVDDALRHAITKLSHLHFPATGKSRSRILNLGEDAWRVHLSRSPGIDGITQQAAPASDIASRFLGIEKRRYALLVYHPVEANDRAERLRASQLLAAVRRAGFEKVVALYPNNDPGHRGVIRCWDAAASESVIVCRDLSRPLFLGLMRDAAVLVGNSSSGIIEAASFGTSVLDVGPRQLGRERGLNVSTIPFVKKEMDRELRRIWNTGKPIRFPRKNVYGGGSVGKRIADVLEKVKIDDRLRRKLIAY